jgi:hypothetical protein
MTSTIRSRSIDIRLLLGVDQPGGRRQKTWVMKKNGRRRRPKRVGANTDERPRGTAGVKPRLRVTRPRLRRAEAVKLTT